MGQDTVRVGRRVRKLGLGLGSWGSSKVGVRRRCGAIRGPFGCLILHTNNYHKHNLEGGVTDRVRVRDRRDEGGLHRARAGLKAAGIVWTTVRRWGDTITTLVNNIKVHSGESLERSAVSVRLGVRSKAERWVRIVTE